VTVWLGKHLAVGGQWDGRLTLTLGLTEVPDAHWMQLLTTELDRRQAGLRANLQRSAREPTLVVRDIGLETLRETLDVIGAALEAAHRRYVADIEFTDMISRQALTIVKEWREELRPPDTS
jgi:hypothetical protein